MISPSTATRPRQEAGHRRDREPAGAPGTAASRFNVLDGALLTARTDARTAFAAAIDSAQHGQSTLLWLGPARCWPSAAALAWLGLQRRLAEYR